jgi:hypothetical protein
MINKDTVTKVINKFNGTVGYAVPELGVRRTFYPKESKDIRFEELEKLSYTPGGEVLLKDYLEITDEDIILALFNEKPEPEYHYSEKEIRELLQSGTLDQFLDCLDFAPDAIKEMIKDLAVEMPLNDVEKRNAIAEKLGFNVTKAIEIKNTKFDGATEEGSGEKTTKSGRRAAPITASKEVKPTGRRYQPNNK